MKKIRVGIDSYSLKPLDLDSFELLDWAIINEADGVQFSEVPPQAGDRAFLLELSQYAAQNDLYIEWGGGEHIPFDLAAGKPKEIASINRRAVEQAAFMGIRTIRSCSGGLMRWRPDSLSTETYLREMATTLRAQKSLFRENGVILAVETHYEFTTFELLRLFEMCETVPGEYLGICLDTMNLLTMLEDPVAATRRILPWVVTTHIKDGAIILAENGLVSFTAEAGKGLVDFKEIFRILGTSGRPLNYSIEDHGGEFLIPIFDPEFLAGFPDLTVSELGALLKLAARTQELVRTRALAALDRGHWPDVCEGRVKRDVKTIRRILQVE